MQEDLELDTRSLLEIDQDDTDLDLEEELEDVLALSDGMDGPDRSLLVSEPVVRVGSSWVPL